MARTFHDLIVKEADGRPRLTFRDRQGTAVLQDVTAEISSPVLQEGDAWGARAAGELMMLDENGVPFAVAPDFVPAEAPAAFAPREKLSSVFAKLAAAMTALAGKADKNGVCDTLTAGDSKKIGGKTLSMSLSDNTLTIEYR